MQCDEFRRETLYEQRHWTPSDFYAGQWVDVFRRAAKLDDEESRFELDREELLSYIED